MHDVQILEIESITFINAIGIPKNIRIFLCRGKREITQSVKIGLGICLKDQLPDLADISSRYDIRQVLIG